MEPMYQNEIDEEIIDLAEEIRGDDEIGGHHVAVEHPFVRDNLSESTCSGCKFRSEEQKLKIYQNKIVARMLKYGHITFVSMIKPREYD